MIGDEPQMAKVTILALREHGSQLINSLICCVRSQCGGYKDLDLHRSEFDILRKYPQALLRVAYRVSRQLEGLPRGGLIYIKTILTSFSIHNAIFIGPILANEGSEGESIQVTLFK